MLVIKNHSSLKSYSTNSSPLNTTTSFAPTSVVVLTRGRVCYSLTTTMAYSSKRLAPTRNSTVTYAYDLFRRIGGSTPATTNGTRLPFNLNVSSTMIIKSSKEVERRLLFPMNNITLSFSLRLIVAYNAIRI